MTEGKVRARERERRGGGAFAGSRGLAVEAGEQQRLEREREKENGTYFGLEVLCKPVTINSLDQYWSPFVLILMVFFVWCRVLL